MKFSAPAAPAAPDPVQSAQTQAQMNKDTAVTQYGLNATNQVTPQGNLSYSQIGTWPDGTPRFQATTSLSPTEQGIYDTEAQTRQNVGNIGVSQSQKISELLNSPVNLSNEATEARLMELGRKRLDPMFAERRSGAETALINKGLRPGTEAFNREMQRVGEQENDAYNQLLLSGRGQSVQEALTERNQPINEITALLSNSQVSQPNFTGTPQAGVAPTDFLGAQGQNLAQQNVGYNAKNQNRMGLMNGLFGLGSSAAAAGGWAMSDRRLKTDIKRVGKLDTGLPIYSYRYKSGGMMQLGLMAQDVEREIPEAVAEVDSGYKAVNYATVAEAVNG